MKQTDGGGDGNLEAPTNSPTAAAAPTATKKSGQSPLSASRPASTHILTIAAHASGA